MNLVNTSVYSLLLVIILSCVFSLYKQECIPVGCVPLSHLPYCLVLCFPGVGGDEVWPGAGGGSDQVWREKTSPDLGHFHI